MKCKRQSHKILQNALPRNFNPKNVKIASASFRDCSPVQVFDSYVQILHSEDDNIKNRNSPGDITGPKNLHTGAGDDGAKRMLAAAMAPSPTFRFWYHGITIRLWHKVWTKTLSFSNIQEIKKNNFQAILKKWNFGGPPPLTFTRFVPCLGRHFDSSLCSWTFATKKTQVTAAELHHRMHHILKAVEENDRGKTPWRIHHNNSAIDISLSF